MLSITSRFELNLNLPDSSWYGGNGYMTTAHKRYSEYKTIYTGKLSQFNSVKATQIPEVEHHGNISCVGGFRLRGSGSQRLGQSRYAEYSSMRLDRELSHLR